MHTYSFLLQFGKFFGLAARKTSFATEIRAGVVSCPRHTCTCMRTNTRLFN